MLIGSDDRPRVADFGLATLDEDEIATPDETTRGTAQVQADTSLTRTGALLGTPAYMSPEQHCGRPADARSDQFSFCVALFEGLYGLRPFRGSSFGEIALQVIHGTITPPPRDARVPERIRRALLRGLSVEADRRWPDMNALLDELAASLRPTRARWLAAGTLALAGLGLGLALAPREADAPCTGAASASERVWNPERAEQVRDRLRGSRGPQAEIVWLRVRRNLDSYVDAWAQQHTDACEAHLRREQSELLFDRRMNCLRRRLADVGALVQVLADDATSAEHAIQATVALPPLDRCGDTEWLLSEVEPPAGAEADVAAQQDRLAEVRALAQTAKYTQGRALADDVVLAAEALGYGPLLAEARFWQGHIARRLAEYTTASDALLAAWWTAQRSRDDEIAIEAALDLGELAVRLKKDEQGRIWAGNAEALVERQGGSPRLQARVLVLQGQLSELAGKQAEALAHTLKALDLQERALGPDHLDVAVTLGRIGRLYGALGEYRRAQAYIERGLAIHERVLGAAHPLTARIVNSAASVYARSGRLDLAIVHFERALAILEQNFGAGHPNTGEVLNNLGSAQIEARKYKEAIVSLERALAIKEAAFGPDHPGLAATLSGLGTAYAERSQHDLAVAAIERSLQILERVHGHEHADVAQALSSLGSAYAAQKRYAEASAALGEAMAVHERIAGPDQMEVAHIADSLGYLQFLQGAHAEARALCRRAIDIWGRLAGPEHFEIAEALINLAHIELAEHADADAISLLTRALTIREAAESPGPALAAARFELGRALWETGTDRPRGMELARQAQADFAANAEGYEETAAALDTWFAAQR